MACLLTRPHIKAESEGVQRGEFPYGHHWGRGRTAARWRVCTARCGVCTELFIADVHKGGEAGNPIPKNKAAVNTFCEKANRKCFRLVSVFSVSTAQLCCCCAKQPGTICEQMNVATPIKCYLQNRQLVLDLLFAEPLY